MGNAESKEVDVSGRELEQLPLGEILLQDSTAGDNATVNAVLDRSVVKLFARRNKIQTLPVELAQFTKLVEISLRDNLLSEFPPVLCQLKSLVKLSLSFNRITKVPSDIQNMRHLALLSLAGNQIEALPEEIGHLTKLQGLDLQRNRLQLLPKSIGQLRALNTLLVHKNRLQSIPDLSELQLLRSLNLSFNQIRFLPGSMCTLHSMEELILSSNQLSMLPIGMFPQMQTLRVLDVHTNLLRSLPADIRMASKSLRRLNLAINKLTSLPMEIGELPRLEWLNLNDNLLKSLPPTIGGLRRLRKLGLVQNQLEYLPQEIGLMRELVKLDVRRNRLRYFPPTMRQMQNLLAVLADGNPLWTQQGPITDSNDNRANKEVLSLRELCARQVWMSKLRDRLAESVRVNENSDTAPDTACYEEEVKCTALERLPIPYTLKAYMDQPELCNFCLNVCCQVHFDYLDNCALMAVRRSMTGIHGNDNEANVLAEEEPSSTQRIPIKLRFCTAQCQQRYVRGETPPVNNWYQRAAAAAHATSSSQSLTIGSQSSFGGSSSLESSTCSSNNGLSPGKSPQFLAVPTSSAQNLLQKALNNSFPAAMTSGGAGSAFHDLWMTFIAGEFRNYDAAESRNGDSDSSLQLDQKTTGNNQSLPTRWLMRQMRNSIPAGTVPRISTTSTAIDVSASSTTEPPSSAEQQVLETF